MESEYIYVVIVLEKDENPYVHEYDNPYHEELHSIYKTEHEAIYAACSKLNNLTEREKKYGFYKSYFIDRYEIGKFVNFGYLAGEDNKLLKDNNNALMPCNRHFNRQYVIYYDKNKDQVIINKE